MKLTIIATAVALLITVGAMSLLASPAMAQEPSMDTRECVGIYQGIYDDAYEECQPGGKYNPYI